MHRCHRLLAGLALAAATCAATTCAQAASFTDLVVFGDSLSDPGNGAALIAAANGYSAPATGSTYSNGPVAAQYLAARFGATVVPGWADATKGNNYAVAGAFTGNGNYILASYAGTPWAGFFSALADTGMAQQIAHYHPTGLQADHTLFLLWGGANDFFLGFGAASSGTPPDVAALTATAVSNLSHDIDALAAKGARHILVPNMPDLGQTPLAASLGIGALGSSATDAFNAGLAGAIAAKQAELAPLGVTLYSFDAASFLRAVVADPAAHGLANVDTACAADPVAMASNCAGYLFFDFEHPTTQAHALLAAGFAGAVGAVPEPASWMLMLPALALLGWRRARVAGSHAAAPVLG
jgi:phospholipase/lecithinase/hemolysin